MANIQGDMPTNLISEAHTKLMWLVNSTPSFVELLLSVPLVVSKWCKERIQPPLFPFPPRRHRRHLTTLAPNPLISPTLAQSNGQRLKAVWLVRRFGKQFTSRRVLCSVRL